MDQVVDRVIALYMDNQRAYDDNPPSPGTTVGEEDGPGDAGRGYEDVNLAISFIDHALQAAQQAVQAQVDEETVVAALLHDIGWLAPKPKDATKLTSADEKIFLAKHDQVGASMLRQLGFTERLARLVEGHVQAKRYLTFKEADYYENLSAGSKFTLKHQGGPMSASEASAFEAEDDFPLYCLMRRWDEAAKIPDMKLPAFDSYRAAIRRCLSAGLWQPRRGYDVNDLLTESDLQSFQNQDPVRVGSFLTDGEVAVLKGAGSLADQCLPLRRRVALACQRVGFDKPAVFLNDDPTDLSSEEASKRVKCATFLPCTWLIALDNAGFQLESIAGDKGVACTWTLTAGDAVLLPAETVYSLSPESFDAEKPRVMVANCTARK